jgi:hypothetical protein
MKSVDKFPFHPTTEKLVDILVQKTQNQDKTFFRMMVAYFFAKVASMMRVSVHIEGTGNLPVNAYVINLATSGSGKGRSIGILEDEVINQFRQKYLEDTFPQIAIDNLSKLSIKRANSKGRTGDPNVELDLLEQEFENAGNMVFSFDSGTSAAVKQMRHKLLLANTGSMNMELDEIGSNLLGNMDVLSSFLELYDVGKIKQKLTKHTKDNSRSTELFGTTPANMLLFGTPTKLLNGGKTEEEFYDMLETGFARRCFFGYSKYKSNTKKFTPEEIYDIFTDTDAQDFLLQLSSQFSNLAELPLHGAVMKMPKDVTLKLLEYRLYCEQRANQYSEYEEMRISEMRHRHFKTAKMAAVYAFVDQSIHIEEDHLKYAIALAEESGHSLDRILNRDRPYVKLASYICSIGREVTEADLTEDLPFYKGNEGARRDMMTLAMAHGMQNNLAIRYRETDGIKFYSGKAMAPTDLDSVIISFSTDMTKNYENRLVKWNKIRNLCLAPNLHWVNHRLLENPEFPGTGGYRADEFIQEGFNLVVIDCDGHVPINNARNLLEKYTYAMYTTKSHTKDVHRFRIILPISHIVELDKLEYKNFMRNVYAWLPFDCDVGTADRPRKWLTNPGTYYENDGELLNAIQFIPNTKKAQEATAKRANQGDLSKIERWFLNGADEGNRNNILYKYGSYLADIGYDIDAIKNSIVALNKKFNPPLEDAEIYSTIMISISKKMNQPK